MDANDYPTQGTNEDAAQRRKRIAASGGRGRVEKYGPDYWPKIMREAKARKRLERAEAALAAAQAAVEAAVEAAKAQTGGRE